MKMTKIIAATLLLTFAHAAQATVITWNLNNFNFQDGATAVGSFEWDSDAESVVSWDFIVSPSANGSPTNFSDTTGTLATDTLAFDTLTFWESGPRWDFRFALPDLALLNVAVANLAVGGDPTFVGAGGFIECRNCSPARFGVRGAYLSAVTVPAPASLALLGLGLLGFSLARRRARS